MNGSFSARACGMQAVLTLLMALPCASRAYGAPQGELDATFGKNGRTTIGLDFDITFGGAIAQQPADGKLVIAGSTLDGNSDWFDFIVARLNIDGSPDTSFGSGGTVLIDFVELRDFATDLAIQTDGRIVVAGYTETAAENFDFALTRLNQDGSIDSTFGIGGFVTPRPCGSKEYISRGNRKRIG